MAFELLQVFGNLSTLTRMISKPSLNWHQPAGPWRTRGANLAALQLSQSRPVHEWPQALWQDHAGYTLWHYWAVSPYPQKEWETLLHQCPNRSHEQVSHAGAHAWHLLALRGQGDMLELWEQTLGTPRLGDWRGDSLLQCAIWSGDAKTIEIALRADPEALNRFESHQTPALILAIYRCTPEVMSQLIRSGINPDLQDSLGRSAMHHAALLGNVELMGELEDAGAETEIEDRDGRTAQDILNHRKGLGGAALRAHWTHKYLHKLAF